jgi:phosphotriesterase-related protein
MSSLSTAVFLKASDNMRVTTVLGEISSEELGITLPHEHLLIDCVASWYQTSPIGELPIAIDMLGPLRRNSSICKDNLILEEKDTVPELAKFKQAGGRSLVDVTVDGLGRNPSALKRISAQTGINIICATGWYLQSCHPAYVSRMSVDELSRIMIKDLTEEIGESDIKAGVIGELGTTEPLHPDEKKVLLAAAKAQGETGVPLTIHPAGYDAPPNRPDNVRHKCARKGEKYIDIIENEAIFEKVYMSHVDGVEIDLDYHRRLLDKGINIDYDLWGLDTAYYDDVYPGAWGVSDNQRVDALLELCAQGYEKNIMLSHDIAMKMQLTKYGGFGYAHILQNVVPVLRYKGMSESQIRTMMIETPKRIFSR